MKCYSVFINFIIIIPLGGVLLLNGCAASAEYNPSKMDTSLNQKITSLEKENPDSVIQFTGKTSENIDEQMKSELEGTGIIVETTAGDIFTAYGDINSIKKVSMIDFIVSLELVKKLDIK